MPATGPWFSAIRPAIPYRFMARAKRDAIAAELHSVAIHLLRRLREADVQSGLSPARLSALSVLTFGGPCTLGELAAAEQVTAPTMSRLVSALEKDDLIARARGGDRRSIVLRATKPGRGVLERARALRIARFTDVLADATPRDLATLEDAAGILGRLLRSES